MKNLPGRQRKNSIVINWSLTYMVILIFSLLIMFWVYTATQKTIREQSSDINEGAIAHMVTETDAKMTTASMMLYELQQDYTLTKLSSYYGDVRALPPYSTYEAHIRLGDALLLTDHVTELMVYYPRTRSIVSSKGVVSTEIYYDAFIKSKGISHGEWLSLFESVNTVSAVPVFCGDTSAEMIYYVRPHSNGSKFIAVIDPDILMRSAKQTLSDLYIVDEQGSLLMEGNENTLQWSELNYSIAEQESKEKLLVQEHSVSGQEYMVSCVRSEISDWYYIASTPMEEYFYGLYWVRRFTAFGILFYLLAGLAIIFMSVRSQYRPVRKLIEDLQGELHYVPRRGNEFIFISDSLQGLRNKHSQELSQYRDKAWYETTLRQIITGERKVRKDVLQDLQEYLERNFSVSDEKSGEKSIPLCYLSAFYICDYGDRTGNEMRTSPAFPELEDYYTYSRMFLYKTLSERMGSVDLGSGSIHAFHISVYNLYISVVFSHVENSHQLLEDISRQICEEVNPQVYMEVKYVTGAHAYSIDQLCDGYEDLLRSITNQEILHLQSLPEFPDLPNRGLERPEILSAENRQYLERLIRTNDIAQLRREIISLYRSYTLTGTASILRGDFPLFLSAFATLAMELVREMHLDESVHFARIAQSVNDVMSGENPIHALRLMMKLFEQISDDFHALNQNSEETQHQNISNHVRNYIDQSYGDANLSLSTIANHFSFSATSLSRIFRENMEMGIPDYINRVRIDKAKSILCSDDYTNLDDLAEQVGYNNTKTLIRAFKRFENITPGQYKELYRDNPRQKL